MRMNGGPESLMESRDSSRVFLLLADACGFASPRKIVRTSIKHDQLQLLTESSSWI